MRNTDRQAFCEVLQAVMALYGRELSGQVIALWWSALGRYDLEDVRMALSAHVTDPDAGQYPPKPADLIRAMHGTSGTQATLAFHRAYDAARLVGAYESVVFDDPAIHGAIAAMGGWVEFCHREVGERGEKLVFVQREFERHYMAAKRHGRGYPRQLCGLAEIENRRNGHCAGTPKLIGDAEKARLTYLHGADGPVLQITKAVDIAANMIAAGG